MSIENVFGSYEEKCSGCGEALLIFDGDKAHAGLGGLLCSVCAKNQESLEISVRVIKLNLNEEMTCNDCGTKLNLLKDTVFDEENFVLCQDCDKIRN